jgi:hypothetical protein
MSRRTPEEWINLMPTFAGFSLESIANQLGVKLDTVKNAITQYGSTRYVVESGVVVRRGNPATQKSQYNGFHQTGIILTPRTQEPSYTQQYGTGPASCSLSCKDVRALVGRQRR